MGHQVAPPRPGEQTWWEESLHTYWWLDRFGLTPAQVATLPVRDQIRLPMLSDVVDEVKAINDKKAARG